jgi:hypothetical protein
MICTSCGAQIADKAIVCYRCGAATALPAAPMRRPKPPRPWPVVVVLALLIVASVWVAAAAAAGSMLRPAGWGVAVVLTILAAWVAVRRR